MHGLKLNRLVQRPALLAAGAVHVGVVRIDVAALDAAEHAVVARPRPEPTPPPLRIQRHHRHRHQQDDGVAEQKFVRRHTGDSRILVGPLQKVYVRPHPRPSPPGEGARSPA